MRFGSDSDREVDVDVNENVFPEVPIKKGAVTGWSVLNLRGRSACQRGDRITLLSCND